MLKGQGTLSHDASGNLTMNIRTTDEKTSDLLRASGIDIRDGVISTEGRTAIDPQNRTLTYVLQGQAPSVKGPLGIERPRHWVVEGTCHPDHEGRCRAAALHRAVEEDPGPVASSPERPRQLYKAGGPSRPRS